MSASTSQPVESGAGSREASVPRPPSRSLELGIAVILIAVPVAFLPMSYAPFVDVKLVLLLAGALTVWAGTRGRSPLSVPAALWVAAMGLSVVFGVDWWWGVFGPENTANGIVLLGTCAFLLVAGTRLPASIRRSVPRWMVGSSVAVASVFLLYRAWPDGFDLVIPDLSFGGGTLGNPVFLAGLMAAGIVVTLGLERLTLPWMSTLLIVQASALSLSTKRVGWVALVAGLAVALWRSRYPRRRALLVVAVVAGTFLGWTVVEAVAGLEGRFSGAGRFAELGTDSARARLTFTPVLVESWAERPVFGWGPGNVWGAYVSSATGHELEVARRGIGDAHNIVLEAAVSTGALGLLAFLGLGGVTIREMWRGPRAAGWAAGGAAALFAYHLLQPNNVYLTPLLFLLAGMACRPAGDGEPEESPGVRMSPRVAHVATGVLLAGGLLVSAVNLTASVMEQYGKTYAYEGTLRASLQVAPRRVSTAEALALHLALDGRAGDEAAAAEAVALAERTVRLHPWNPGVRLVAADVHVLLNDWESAARWVREHLRLFPEDTIPQPSEGAPTFTELEDPPDRV